ncbi:hypothetical protein Y032_0052g2192 [Ancylostoma ceylanicum]|uniref:Uncharacterized protein n=1 Tax=Ancylostoma ceylanicum TaxID=53326 RepID=A0A016U840_9BILA|nr:hypothetical protein Y032_0052g2192 [Ancylostoma ceylanicum]
MNYRWFFRHLYAVPRGREEYAAQRQGIKKFKTAPFLQKENAIACTTSRRTQEGKKCHPWLSHHEKLQSTR